MILQHLFVLLLKPSRHVKIGLLILVAHLLPFLAHRFRNFVHLHFWVLGQDSLSLLFRPNHVRIQRTLDEFLLRAASTTEHVILRMELDARRNVCKAGCFFIMKTREIGWIIR